MVIFLRDPLHPKNHEPDIKNNIFTLCDTHNIPLATNLATAELLILALDRGDLDWREFSTSKYILQHRYQAVEYISEVILCLIKAE